MATLEQVIKDAYTLPPDEKRKLIEAIDRDLRNAEAFDKHRQEITWIEQHRDEYLGQWVALDGNRLLAHGTNAKEVADAARAAGVKAPFLERVEPKVEAYWGGWV